MICPLEYCVKTSTFRSLNFPQHAFRAAIFNFFLQNHGRMTPELRDKKANDILLRDNGARRVGKYGSSKDSCTLTSHPCHFYYFTHVKKRAHRVYLRIPRHRHNDPLRVIRYPLRVTRCACMSQRRTTKYKNVRSSCLFRAL